jgi:hypothetical protein
MEAGIDDLMEAIWIGNQLESNELLALSYTRASIVMLFMEVERRSWEFALRGLHFAKLTERDQYLHYSLTVLHNHMLAMEQPEEATKYEKKLLTVKKRLHLLVGKTGFASRSKSREKHLKQLQHYVSLAENSEDTAELAEVVVRTRSISRGTRQTAAIERHFCRAPRPGRNRRDRFFHRLVHAQERPAGRRSETPKFCHRNLHYHASLRSAPAVLLKRK